MSVQVGVVGVHRGLPAMLTAAPTPGPNWTATFDPVPTDFPTSLQDSREKELCPEHPVPQGPLGLCQDLPTPSLASPAAPDAMQLR